MSNDNRNAKKRNGNMKTTANRPRCRAPKTTRPDAGDPFPDAEITFFTGEKNLFTGCGTRAAASETSSNEQVMLSRKR
jgi:hypothetical protein